LTSRSNDVQQILQQAWREDDGVLSFEWTIITVVIVFGIVGGFAAIRDALIDELGDMAEAVIEIDQSFSFSGLPAFGIPPSSFTDPPGSVTDCGRQTTPLGHPGSSDAPA